MTYLCDEARQVLCERLVNRKGLWRSRSSRSSHIFWNSTRLVVHWKQGSMHVDGKSYCVKLNHDGYNAPGPTIPVMRQHEMSLETASAPPRNLANLRHPCATPSALRLPLFLFVPPCLSSDLEVFTNTTSSLYAQLSTTKERSLLSPGTPVECSCPQAP